ncbi:UNVERIFIED_CONTAM: hypothetical protein Q9R58_20415 [Methylobacteriaceae bacterium AG10]|nr:hypothetical protein [Methylobacteriaceae bacterium AG10]
MISGRCIFRLCGAISALSGTVTMMMHSAVSSQSIRFGLLCLFSWAAFWLLSVTKKVFAPAHNRRHHRKTENSKRGMKIRDGVPSPLIHTNVPNVQEAVAIPTHKQRIKRQMLLDERNTR